MLTIVADLSSLCNGTPALPLAYSAILRLGGSSVAARLLLGTPLPSRCSGLH